MQMYSTITENEALVFPHDFSYFYQCMLQYAAFTVVNGNEFSTKKGMRSHRTLVSGENCECIYSLHSKCKIYMDIYTFALDLVQSPL